MSKVTGVKDNSSAKRQEQLGLRDISENNKADLVTNRVHVNRVCVNRVRVNRVCVNRSEEKVIVGDYEA